jgi:hypothetical protein
MDALRSRKEQAVLQQPDSLPGARVSMGARIQVRNADDEIRSALSLQPVLGLGANERQCTKAGNASER